MCLRSQLSRRVGSKMKNREKGAVDEDDTEVLYAKRAVTMGMVAIISFLALIALVTLLVLAAAAVAGH